jgi:serine/threonine protein kinase
MRTVEIDAKLYGQNGSYVVKKILGEGFQGETYLAEKIGVSETQVVIKIPKVHYDLQKNQIDERLGKISSSFSREMTAYGRLVDDKNPVIKKIAAVLDTGSIQYRPSGSQIFLVPFLVQEYVQGFMINEWLDQFCSEGNEFKGIKDVDLWFKIAKKLLYIISQIHKSRVVHGDIWPPNVIMKLQGVLKDQPKIDDFEPILIDFGQAWLVDNEEKIGKGGTSSYAYYAPERHYEGGKFFSSVDIFAISGILYYLASGSDPVKTFVDDQGKAFRPKAKIREDIINGIIKNNPDLYYANPGIIEIISYGFWPIVDQRALTADHMLELTEIYENSGKDTINNEFIGQEADYSTITRVIDKYERRLKLANSNDILVNLTTHDILSMRRHVSSTGFYSVPGGNRDELINHLLIAMKCLNSGDEITALTTNMFWGKRNFGPNGRLLTMLKISALKGVKINWLLLVEKSDVEEDKEDAKYIVDSQKNTIEDLRKIAYFRKLPIDPTSSDFHGYNVRVREISSYEHADIRRNRETFIRLAQKHSIYGKEITITASYTYLGDNISNLMFSEKTPEISKSDPQIEYFNSRGQDAISITNFRLT